MPRTDITRTVDAFYDAVHRILDGIDASFDAEQAIGRAGHCGRRLCARAQRCRRPRRCTALARRPSCQMQPAP